jgi:hypothetical protein
MRDAGVGLPPPQLVPILALRALITPTFSPPLQPRAHPALQAQQIRAGVGLIGPPAGRVPRAFMGSQWGQGVWLPARPALPVPTAASQAPPLARLVWPAPQAYFPLSLEPPPLEAVGASLAGLPPAAPFSVLPTFKPHSPGKPLALTASRGVAPSLASVMQQRQSSCFCLPLLFGAG